MSTPPVLTPDRIDAMLSRVAEACMVGVDEAEARLGTAEDAEAFERTTRAFQTLCRNLRQTIALKQRFDRGQITLAAERRGEAEVLQADATRVREAAVKGHHAEVRRRIRSLIWNEYDTDDVYEVLGDLDDFLRDMAKDDGFLEIPVETHLERLMAEFSPVEDEVEDDDEAAPEPPPIADDDRASRADVPQPPSPPPRPPDPPPGAAWGRLGPGQTWPGSPGY